METACLMLFQFLLNSQKKKKKKCDLALETTVRLVRELRNLIKYFNERIMVRIPKTIMESERISLTVKIATNVKLNECEDVILVFSDCSVTQLCCLVQLLAQMTEQCADASCLSCVALIFRSIFLFQLL